MPTTTTPTMSIVVPVFQVAEYLPRCLDSILNDAGDRVEVVAVNDHSPDRCGEILDDYAARDHRVRVVHLPVNAGLGPARNVGLEHASGDYLWFVDSDDWLPPGSVPAVLARLAATRPDLLMLDHVEVTGGQVIATRSGPILRSVTTPVRIAQRPQLLRTALVTSACTKVIDRRLLSETGLRFPLGWYEDCAFTYPLLLAASRIDTLARVSYCYRQRPGAAITKSVSDRHFDVFGQYQRMWESVDKAAPAHDPLRPELFRLMVDHLLVIAGNERRLPAGLRREFFRRIVSAYRDRVPPGGYPVPGGIAGLKHRLVRWRAYPLYALLRLVWRLRLAGARRMPVDDIRAADAPSRPARAGGGVAGSNHAEPG